MTRAHTEEGLVERARSGDQQAYAELVRQHQALAFRVAYLVTRDADDAMEATQDGFVKAWRALDRFTPGASFRPWVLRIVRNEALNAVRGRSRRRRAHDRLGRQPLTASPPAEAEAMDRLQQRVLLDAIERLPGGQRQVVECLYLLGLSEAETATTLGVPRGTVKSRAARARRALQQEMAE